MRNRVGSLPGSLATSLAEELAAQQQYVSEATDPANVYSDPGLVTDPYTGTEPATASEPAQKSWLPILLIGAAALYFFTKKKR